MSRRYSVVIPTYNRRDTVLLVLEALAQQEAPELLHEVVVVDDGSSDGTVEAIEQLDSPLKIRLLTGRRGGPAAARNAGIEVASGTHLLFLCDDIEPSKGLLEAHAARSRQIRGPCAVVGRVDWPPDKEVSHLENYVIENYHFGFERFEGREELPFYGFITANLSIERGLIIELDGFDDSFSYGWEDTDLGLRAVNVGVPIIYAPDALGYHHHDVTPTSYCRRQAAVGASSVRFLRKHPDHGQVVGAAKMPRPCTARWLVKGALFNRFLNPLWVQIARMLSAAGARRTAELLYSQVLAGCFYRSMARELNGADISAEL